MATVQDRSLHSPPSRSASLPKPKGILKNAPNPNPHNLSLTWDEENLALTEIQKDSLMKITEPKTPFVRYNPITDEVEGDIPNLDLSYVGSPPGSPSAASSTGAEASGLSSRRTSFSSAQGTAGRSGSGTSSRSTSFNLPNETRNEFRSGAESAGGEIEVEEEMDEETAAKHAAFVRARRGHYSNEAEAMKRAAALRDDEDDDGVPPLPGRRGGDDTDDYSMDESGTDASEAEYGSGFPPTAPKLNGARHG